MLYFRESYSCRCHYPGIPSRIERERERYVYSSVPCTAQYKLDNGSIS